MVAVAIKVDCDEVARGLLLQRVGTEPFLWKQAAFNGLLSPLLLHFLISTPKGTARQRVERCYALPGGLTVR